MDFRYLLGGSLIIVISATSAIYSLIVGIEAVLGVSLTTLVLGVVVLTTGLTYGEPLTELFRMYSKDLSRLVSKVLEDSGLLGSSRFKICLEGFKAVISAKPVNCLETSLGFGLVGEVPYVAVPLDSIASFDVVGSDLRDYLSEILSKRFRLCRGINLLVGDDVYTVELVSVSNEVIELVKSPLNYVKFLTLGMGAKYLSSSLELVGEDLVGSNYVVRFKVVR